MPNCEFPSLEAGAACPQCGYRLRRNYETAPRRQCTPLAPCRHLGNYVDATFAIIECNCPSGEKTTAQYPIAICRVNGECLPDFRCTAANKNATQETWTRTDGKPDAYLMSCEFCRADNRGFEPLIQSTARRPSPEETPCPTK